ncbi:ribonuclease E/G, partial [Dietzia natronolimnaea]|nr:ribonuclease E/G [Dietzia natronolimnaea]
MSDSNLTIDDLNALPEKMRAHAAAKAVGMTSKEFLAAMAGIGVEVRSAQSGVTREVLLTWFASRAGGGDTTSEAATATEDAPVEKPARAARAEKAPAKKAPARKAAAEKAPADKAPAKKARKAAASKTAPDATAEPTTEKKSGTQAPVRRPLPEMSI